MLWLTKRLTHSPTPMAKNNLLQEAALRFAVLVTLEKVGGYLCKGGRCTVSRDGYDSTSLCTLFMILNQNADTMIIFFYWSQRIYTFLHDLELN